VGPPILEFMDHKAFDHFIHLVELDQLLLQLLKEKEELIQSEHAMQTELQHLQQKSMQAHQSVTSLKKEIHNLDLELQALEAQEKDKKRKLESAGTPKEFFSLEHELEELQKKRKRYEEPYMELLEKLEKAEHQLAEIQKQVPVKIEELEKAFKKSQERAAYLEARVEALHKERKSHEAHIPQEMLEEYDRMKERVANPVVPILKDSCSACFYTITQQMMHETKHQRKLVKCHDCYRLLYVPPSSSTTMP
jgi:predicted  nucleic acid-binding Zn-ribbon protein